MARYAFILPLMIATIPEEGGETLETAAPLEETVESGVLIEIEAPTRQDAASEFEKRLKRTIGAVCTVASEEAIRSLMTFPVPQHVIQEQEREAKMAAQREFELERRMAALNQDRSALGALGKLQSGGIDQINGETLDAVYDTRTLGRTLPETEPAPHGEGKDDVDLPPLDLVDDRDPGRGPSGEQGIQKV